ncbi:transposase [Acinetobacter kyonggiensis]|uniref:transposase n=1 Tax=Acinetobacter kyonggiensis TaxID=595670 RepID=UPI003CC7A62F
MYLPAYSPALNLIEKYWAVLKQKIRLLLFFGYCSFWMRWKSFVALKMFCSCKISM